MLIVDDEDGIRRVLRHPLEKRECSVLPGKSGLGLFDECVAEVPSLVGRWVFLTGSAKEPDVIAQVESRGVPLLSKLYELEFAVDAVEVALLPAG